MLHPRFSFLTNFHSITSFWYREPPKVMQQFSTLTALNRDAHACSKVPHSAARWTFFYRFTGNFFSGLAIRMNPEAESMKHRMDIYTTQHIAHRTFPGSWHHHLPIQLVLFFMATQKVQILVRLCSINFSSSSSSSSRWKSKQDGWKDDGVVTYTHG